MAEDFKSEIENRLEDLFQEDEESAESVDRFGGVGDHPLKALKAMVLSVEWEITDSSMESLIKELNSLQDFYGEDRIILSFLRLLGSISTYIKVRKGKSHPNAMGLLTSIYEGLEKVALSEGMNRQEREKILLQEVEKFKKLKADIIRRKKEEKMGELDGPETERAAPDPAEMSSHELFAYALEEIKEVIRAEFRALRAEIKLWRESR